MHKINRKMKQMVSLRATTFATEKLKIANYMGSYRANIKFWCKIIILHFECTNKIFGDYM